MPLSKSRPGLLCPVGSAALWLCPVSFALIQSVLISPNSFLCVDVPIQVEIDMGVRPFWSDADAMVATLVAPPIQLHEKVFVWKYKAVI